ncbi:MAG TPA: hypothetical protein PKK10_01685 [Woeseiaceae bacterium]|nr:hypothetical protein [Woeseiaceae bacterium]
MPRKLVYDTVAFDVRDNATMLLFARTSEHGDIEDYVLIMRTVEEDFDESIYVEINEKQLGGHDLLQEARLLGNTLTLVFNEPVTALDKRKELVLTFLATESNLGSVEKGAFRVLGEVLAGGSA